MKTQRVLIVDGNQADLEKHSAAISGAGYTVLKPGGCAEAAGILARYRGKVIVLSGLSSKEGSGIDFLKETLKAYPSLPFTVLVSSPSLDTATDAMKAGAFDLLRKPVSKEVLCRSVARSAQRMVEIREREKREKEMRSRLSRSRKELREAKALASFKGFMMSMAAHDFRTILTVLEGYLQLALEKCRGCSETDPDGMMDRASRTAVRLQRMANTLLDYEAAETGRFRAESKPVPLGDVLRECAAFYGPIAEKKRIGLFLDWNGPEFMVQGDRLVLLEILDNIVYNALKFTPAGESIRIYCRQGSDSATVTVSDTGPGIPKERLETIFRKDCPVAPGDPSGRWGLGLKICKCLVEAQKGQLQVNSVLGQGTEVSFSIPAAQLP
jgi:signal transduction histidine kinase